jgi:hypothetical protein
MIVAKEVSYLESEEKKLIVDKVQEILTIHDLFSDYTGGSFQAEIKELEPKGNELW